MEVDVLNPNLVNPKSTAILVVDVQNAYVSKGGSLARLGYNVEDLSALPPKIDSFLTKAGEFSVPIIFTKMIEDSQYMAENAKIKLANNPYPISSPGTYDYEYSSISPKKGDIEIIKKSYDAFTEDSLSVALKERSIKSLIIIGALSDICVDSTVRSAFSRGYNVIVPLDLTSTIKERSMEFLMDVWGSVFAHLTNSDDIISIWEGK